MKPNGFDHILPQHTLPTSASSIPHASIAAKMLASLSSSSRPRRPPLPAEADAEAALAAAPLPPPPPRARSCGCGCGVGSVGSVFQSINSTYNILDPTHRTFCALKRMRIAMVSLAASARCRARFRSRSPS